MAAHQHLHSRQRESEESSRIGLDCTFIGMNGPEIKFADEPKPHEAPNHSKKEQDGLNQETHVLKEFGEDV